MATKSYNIRMDEDLRRQADEVSEQLGLSFPAAVNIFAKRYVAEQGFPFLVQVPQRHRGIDTVGLQIATPKVNEHGELVMPTDWDDEEDDAVYDEYFAAF